MQNCALQNDGRAWTSSAVSGNPAASRGTSYMRICSYSYGIMTLNTRGLSAGLRVRKVSKTE